MEERWIIHPGGGGAVARSVGTREKRGKARFFSGCGFSVRFASTYVHVCVDFAALPPPPRSCVIIVSAPPPPHTLHTPKLRKQELGAMSFPKPKKEERVSAL